MACVSTSSFILNNNPEVSKNRPNTHLCKTMVQEMKKFASFTSTNSPKMERRTIIRKNRHRKHATKHWTFNNLVSYLISDCHMYNPLVSPQPSFDLPPPKHIFTYPLGIKDEVALPVKGRNKKLIEKIVDFLEADCYLYSPLVNINQHVFSNKDSGGEMQKGSRVGGVVMKSVGYRESVKQRVLA